MARHRHVASETQSQFAVEEYRSYIGVGHTICRGFFQISRNCRCWKNPVPHAIGVGSSNRMPSGPRSQRPAGSIPKRGALPTGSNACGFRDRAVSTTHRAVLSDQDLFVSRGIAGLCVGSGDGQLEQHSGQKNLRQFIQRSFIQLHKL